LRLSTAATAAIGSRTAIDYGVVTRLFAFENLAVVGRAGLRTVKPLHRFERLLRRAAAGHHLAKLPRKTPENIKGKLNLRKKYGCGESGLNAAET
jgi:hypothetical protein